MAKYTFVHLYTTFLVENAKLPIKPLFIAFSLTNTSKILKKAQKIAETYLQVLGGIGAAIVGK